ncbi:hypothetical protein Tco_1020682 [Tanacetum coccineum]
MVEVKNFMACQTMDSYMITELLTYHVTYCSAYELMFTQIVERRGLNNDLKIEMKVRDVILGLVMIWIVVYVIKDVAVKVDKMMGMSVIRALKVTSAEEVRILKVTSAEEVRIPCEGACVFSDRCSLDELVYGAPSEGPYPPTFLLPMISSRMFKKIEKVKSLAFVIKKKLSLLDFIIGENLELQNESYVLYDRVMNPLAAQLERKPRRDRGTRRGRHSTSLSSTFDQPSSSHLNDDDDNGNDEGTSRASTPSPIRYVNSLTNQVPQVF